MEQALLAIDDEGQLRPSLDATRFCARPGWVVLALSKRAEETAGLPAIPAASDPAAELPA